VSPKLVSARVGRRPHPNPLPEGEGAAESPLPLGPLGEAGRSTRERARTDEGVTPAGGRNKSGDSLEIGRAMR